MAKGKANNNGTNKKNKTARKHPRKHSPRVFGRAAKAILGEATVFSTGGARTTGHPHVTESSRRPCAFHKTDSKWAIALRAIKLLEDNGGENLGKNLDTKPKAWSTEETVDVGLH